MKAEETIGVLIGEIEMEVDTGEFSVFLVTFVAGSCIKGRPRFTVADWHFFTLTPFIVHKSGKITP